MPHHALEGAAVWLSAPNGLDLSGIEFRLHVQAKAARKVRTASLWIIGPALRLPDIAISVAEHSPASFLAAETGFIFRILVLRQDAERAAPTGQPTDDLPIVVISATVQAAKATVPKRVKACESC